MDQNKMTSRFAKSTIFVCNIFLVFHLKFVYVMGLAPLRCEIWLVHMTVVELTILILFVSYIILSVVVYRQTETRLNESETLGDGASETLRTPGETFDQEMVVIAGGIVTESRQLTTYGSEFLGARPLRHRSANNVRPAEPIPVDIDLEASRSLVMGVIPLVLTVCPLLILLLAFLFCQLIGQFDCSIFTWLVTYFKELSLIQAVYNPFIFLWKNEELRKALLAIN
jgi:dopamine receptor D1